MFCGTLICGNISYRPKPSIRKIAYPAVYIKHDKYATFPVSMKCLIVNFNQGETVYLEYEIK